jgi:hypothetical protein
VVVLEGAVPRPGEQARLDRSSISDLSFALAVLLAGPYLAIAVLLVVGAAMEHQDTDGATDGSFLSGFALVATLPLSLGVMAAYSGIASARGVPHADQDGGGLWTLAAFGVLRPRQCLGDLALVPGTSHRCPES